MDANQRTPRPRLRRWTPLGCMLAGLAMAATSAQGSPMRRAIAAPRATAAVAPSPFLPPAWERFLSAPDLWTTTRAPSFTLMVRRAVWQVLNGDPAEAAVNPMIDYLVWRRDLNPYRFDHYHPLLGPRLGQLPSPTADPPILAPMTALPVAPVAPPIWPLAPLTPSPPQVPEPGSLVLIALVSAWGVWRRSRTAARPL